MGTKLNNAPVFFTIAQIQHNQILALDSFIPKIQDDMRKAGYPDFSQSLQLTFNLLPTPQGESAQPSQNVQPVQIKRYQFCNLASTSGFILQQNSLSFQTTEYDTFDPFIEVLFEGLGILNGAVDGLSFTDRIGLRYLNAVVPSSGENLENYLVPELMGLPGRLKNTGFAYSFTEALIVIPDVGHVTSRTIIQQPGPIGFPQELRPDPLKLSQRFAQIDQEHAIIDTDGSHLGREPYSAESIQRTLSRLHDEIEESFIATVTSHARKSWQ